jgi:hypothetical protein
MNGTRRITKSLPSIEPKVTETEKDERGNDLEKETVAAEKNMQPDVACLVLHLYLLLRAIYRDIPYCLLLKHRDNSYAFSGMG